MIYRNFPSIAGVFLLLFLCSPVIANHGASEPTDGTVKSFRWFYPPGDLGEVIIHDANNQPVSLFQFKNKIVLLNLWASWCPPCLRELPELDRLQQRLGSDDFIVVAVSIDEDPNLARQMFNDRLSLKHLKLYVDPEKNISRNFPVDVLPSNFFINRKGQAAGILRSYVDWGSAEADTLIKRLIDGVDTKTLNAEKKQSGKLK